jgi:hypothetical protein
MMGYAKPADSATGIPRRRCQKIALLMSFLGCRAYFAPVANLSVIPEVLFCPEIGA